MLVLDANILMRAVLGRQARALLAKYGGRIEFVAPDVAFEEARKHLPEVIERRKLEAEPFLDYFDSLANVVQIDGDIGWHAFRHSYRSWLDDTGARSEIRATD
jgi:predicted nucleic acid-binding protein